MELTAALVVSTLTAAAVRIRDAEVVGHYASYGDSRDLIGKMLFFRPSEAGTEDFWRLRSAIADRAKSHWLADVDLTDAITVMEACEAVCEVIEALQAVLSIDDLLYDLPEVA